MNISNFLSRKIIKFIFGGVIILFIFFSLSVFYVYKFDKNLFFQCPDKFSSSEEYVTSVAEWTNSYLKDHPNATQEEIGSKRISLLKEFNCGESPFK